MSTGHLARRTTFSATEPNTNRRQPVVPWVAITIRSAFSVSHDLVGYISVTHHDADSRAVLYLADQLRQLLVGIVVQQSLVLRYFEDIVGITRERRQNRHYMNQQERSPNLRGKLAGNLERLSRRFAEIGRAQHRLDRKHPSLSLTYYSTPLAGVRQDARGARELS